MSRPHLTRARLAVSALTMIVASGLATASPDEVAATRLADTTTDPYTFGGSRPREFTRVGDQVFFAAGTRLTGRELFVTDGTEQGTRRVVELVPGAGGAFPRNLIESEGLLYFEADTAARGTGAWRSDGTAAGTVPVAALPEPPTGPALVPGSNDVRDLEFFSAEAEGKGHELFRTDGTVDGTYLVKDIYPGTGSSVPGQFTRVGDIVFFSARTEEHGIELWKTDGTAQGTVLVKDVRPGPDWGATRHLAALDDRLLLFSGWDEEHQAELWRSDGTEAGTYFVKDLAPAFHQAGDPHDIRDMGDGTAYFAAATDLALIELWRTDGTAEGTYLVKDIEPDHHDAHVDDVVGVTDGVLFTASRDPGSAERVLWASDGTTAGTLRRDMNVTGGAAPHASVRSGDSSIGFIPDTGLFISGGLAGPGSLLTVPVPTSSTNVWGHLIPFGEKTLFQIDVGTFPFFRPELWITDGTEDGASYLGGASRAGDIEDDVAYLGDAVYMANGGGGLERTDGTPDGTFGIPIPTPGSRDANSVTSVGERVLFVALNGATRATSLFVYTPADDHMRSIDTVDVRQFEATEERQLRSLWGIGTTALFMRHAADELWMTDGTAFGTARLATVVPGWGQLPGMSDIDPIRVGSRVLFAAMTEDHGVELWRVEDGVTGSALVADIAPGSADSLPNGLLPLGSSEYAVFAAHDAEHGMELWITDGTASGTTLLADVRPGTESSNPRLLVQAGTDLFFVADGDDAGEEPWSVSLAELGLPDSAFDGSRGYDSNEQPVGLAPEFLDVSRLRAKLDFRRTAKDRINARGALPLADDFAPEGARVVVQVEDFTLPFVLDGKGRAKFLGNKFELLGWKQSRANARYKLKLSGDIKQALAASGLTPDAGKQPADHTLRVTLAIDGLMHTTLVNVSYRVKKRRGKATSTTD